MAITSSLSIITVITIAITSSIVISIEITPVIIIVVISNIAITISITNALNTIKHYIIIITHYNNFKFINKFFNICLLYYLVIEFFNINLKKANSNHPNITNGVYPLYTLYLLIPTYTLMH